jgi:hypothetical protein
VKREEEETYLETINPGQVVVPMPNSVEAHAVLLGAYAASDDLWTQSMSGIKRRRSL